MQTIELVPSSIPVMASAPVRRAIIASRRLMARLDIGSQRAAAGDKQALIFAAFDIVRSVYPNLEKPARADAMELVSAWSQRYEPLVKYAQSAWAPYVRCVKSGQGDLAEIKGVTWLYANFPSGAGKKGYVPEGDKEEVQQ